MLEFLPWAMLGFSVASTIVMVLMLNSGFQYLYVRSTEPALDDDTSALEHFLSLLGAARESMIVYDDGDSSKGSLFDDPRVVGAVRQKLSANPAFDLQCLFNCDDDLLLRRELEDQPQVSIRTRSGSAAAYDVHYKVIDGGEKAYLSHDMPGSSYRRFKLVDCTNVSQRHRERVANTVLRRYKEHFETAFAASMQAT